MRKFGVDLFVLRQLGLFQAPQIGRPHTAVFRIPVVVRRNRYAVTAANVFNLGAGNCVRKGEANDTDEKKPCVPGEDQGTFRYRMICPRNVRVRS